METTFAICFRKLHQKLDENDESKNEEHLKLLLCHQDVSSASCKWKVKY